jgi:hypothetical protein
MGMERSIGGRLDIRFVPSLQVALADVHVRNHGDDVVSAGEVDLGIELLSLRGVAQAKAKDVAMATQENRVALKGGLNFANGHFDEVTVALIDAKGCPRVLQKIRGPFLSRQVEKPSVLRALAGPTRRLFTQARSLLGGQCDGFYAGSVALQVTNRATAAPMCATV